MMKTTAADVLSSIMTTEVVTVDVKGKMEDALRAMVEFDVGSVIVTDNGRPVGIITERDVTRALMRGDQLLPILVTRLMSGHLQTSSPDDEIWRAFETMLKLRIRRLPIVQEGKLVGIVTEKDLTRWVLRVFYEPNIPEELRSLVENTKPSRSAR
jgi:CBS domain-containing protein